MFLFLGFSFSNCPPSSVGFDSSADALINGISEEFIQEHQRISEVLRHHCKIFCGQDVSAVKLVSTQLVTDTLNQAINYCMVFYGMAPPVPSVLCVFDPSFGGDIDPEDEDQCLAHLVEMVTTQLNRVLRQWMQRRLRFKFCVRYIRRWRSPGADADTYVFEAKFSVPTKLLPTPQCTASVFFVLDVPAIDRSSSEQIYVPYRYQFEGLHYMYTPSARGHIFDFQEKLLTNIMEHKMKLYQRLQF